MNLLLVLSEIVLNDCQNRPYLLNLSNNLNFAEVSAPLRMLGGRLTYVCAVVVGLTE